MRDTLIVKTRVLKLSGRLFKPFKIATGQHDRLDNFVLSVRLADGTEGFGEAAPAPHITGEPAGLIIARLNLAARLLRGRDVCDYLRISAELQERWPRSFACAAVETAVFDALARHASLPLWKLFGSRCETLRTDMTVTLGTIQDAYESALDIRNRGIKAIKIKVGAGPEEDFARVLAVHKAAPKLPLYLDANQGFTAKQTLAFLRRLKSKGVVPAFLEQPVPKDDWDGLREVTRKSGLCVGADESIQSFGDAVRAVKGGFVNAVNIKVMKFGLVESREIARFCLARGVKLMAGAMLESALGCTASAHLAAGMGGFSFIDLDTPFFIKTKVTRGGALSRDGVYALSGISRGIGVRPAPPR